MPLHHAADAEMPNLADEDVPLATLESRVGDDQRATAAIDADGANRLSGSVRPLELDGAPVRELPFGPAGEVETPVPERVEKVLETGEKGVEERSGIDRMTLRDVVQ